MYSIMIGHVNAAGREVGVHFPGSQGTINFLFPYSVLPLLTDDVTGEELVESHYGKRYFLRADVDLYDNRWAGYRVI